MDEFQQKLNQLIAPQEQQQKPKGVGALAKDIGKVGFQFGEKLLKAAPELALKVGEEIVSAPFRPIRTIKGVAKFGGEVARGLARDVIATTAPFADILIKGEPIKEPLQPAGTLLEPILGKEPIKPIQEQIREIKEQTRQKIREFLTPYFGEERAKQIAEVGGLGTGLGMGALVASSIIPLAPTKNIAKQIAKESSEEVIANILRSSLKNIPEEEVLRLSKMFAPVRDAKMIENELKNVVGELGKRQFTERIVKQEAKGIPRAVKQQIKKDVDLLFRDVHHDPQLVSQAQEFIRNQGIDKALLTFHNQPLSDFTQTLGRQLIPLLEKEKRYDDIYDIIKKVAGESTEIARNFRQLQFWGTLSPEGLVEMAHKTLQEFTEKLTQNPANRFLARLQRKSVDALKLTEDEIKKLMDIGKRMQRAESELERIRLAREAREIIADKIPWTMRDLLLDIWNLPRTFTAGFFDLSATLMHNAMFAARHPILTLRNFWEAGVKPFFSEKAYENVMRDILTNPLLDKMEKAKLAITDLTADRILREEQFRSVLAERIPVLKYPIRMSERAWTAFLNKMRADSFEMLYRNFERAGVNIDDKALHWMGRFINAATGRGDLGKMAVASNYLAQILFSPRKLLAAAEMMAFPVWPGIPAPVRKEILKTWLSFLGAGLTILGLAKLSGAEVGTDPDSADFGKIKVGNTRINVFGPYQQYAVLFHRLLSGRYVSSVTGREFDLGVGYKPVTGAELIGRWFDSKIHPTLSFIESWLRGRRFTGEKFELGPAIIDAMMPMILQDLNDLIAEHGMEPKTPLFAFLSFLGLPVQTYGNFTLYTPYLKLLPSGERKIEVEPPPSVGRRVWEFLFGKQLEPGMMPVPEDMKKQAILKWYVDGEKNYIAQRKGELRQRVLRGEMTQEQALAEMERILNDAEQRVRKVMNELGLDENTLINIYSEEAAVIQ
jgi:hypothetical protein